MLKNLTREIIYYSVIPVLIITIVVVLLLIIGKKKNDNYFKYNYSIKVLLIIILSLMFSLMLGYTIWAYERIINMGTISQNILYLILLAIVVISLLVLFILMIIKIHNDFKLDSEEKEFQNE